MYSCRAPGFVAEKEAAETLESYNLRELKSVQSVITILDKEVVMTNC